MARANKLTVKCCWCSFPSCYGEDVVSDENQCDTPTKKLICLIIYFKFSSTNSSKFSEFYIAWMRCRVLCSLYRGLFYSQMHAIKIGKNGTHTFLIFNLIFLFGSVWNEKEKTREFNCDVVSFPIYSNAKMSSIDLTHDCVRDSRCSLVGRLFLLNK